MLHYHLKVTIYAIRVYSMNVLHNHTGHIKPVPYSVQSVGAAFAVSLAIGHNPGQVATPTQYTSMLALILPTTEG